MFSMGDVGGLSLLGKSVKGHLAAVLKGVPGSWNHFVEALQYTIYKCYEENAVPHTDPSFYPWTTFPEVYEPSLYRGSSLDRSECVIVLDEALSLGPQCMVLLRHVCSHYGFLQR
jgi:hypothetical protein